ncbi:MAG: hypothetical protein LUI14_10885 [Lachnospiraceae bacterium]|nr:hypothetical protein [Lachnospiraceae bacterium]
MEATKYNLNLQTKGLGNRLCDIESRGIRNKVLNAIFGGKNRLLIIAPEDCVKSISFEPLDEGKAQKGDHDGDEG